MIELLKQISHTPGAKTKIMLLLVVENVISPPPIHLWYMRHPTEASDCNITRNEWHTTLRHTGVLNINVGVLYHCEFNIPPSVKKQKQANPYKE